ncbi:MAG TPA: hypothetical protein VFK51_05410 [Burkholderiales bacterium]|nr:hypothetical protein [Burkholderiales bacterium]
MNVRELGKAFAMAAVLLLGLLPGTPAVLADGTDAGHQRANTDPVPFMGPVPEAHCGSGDRTEGGLQGQTTPGERSSGDSKRGYNCNLQLVGRYPGEGAYSQDGPAYDGDCAYYATDRHTSTQQHHGVTVIDASDPQHPHPTAYLDDTAAALDPHETLQTNERRHLLVVAQHNGPDFAVYDTSDCRHPVLKADIKLPGSQAHMGNFAPDGLTYYVGQKNRGKGGSVYIVDLSDPSHPQQLPAWQYSGDGRPHEAELNPKGFEPGVPEGTRLYAGQPGLTGNTGSSIGPDGLVIEDVSDYQLRRPHPQIRIISKLFWKDQGQAEEMLPVTIKGHPYIISTDEDGGEGGVGGIRAACARGASPFGFAQIIDVADETKPKIVAKLMLQVSDPANCSKLADDPPDAGGKAPDYSGERCTADRPDNATMLACGYRAAGLRVFDIRDPYHPKEVAYWKPPAVGTEVLPASGSWKAGADRTVDRIAGWVRWVVAGNGKSHGHGNGAELQLWTVSDDNGFQILRFTDSFKQHDKALYEESLRGLEQVDKSAGS